MLYQCTKCKKEKPAIAFYKSNLNTVKKIESHCIACKTAYRNSPESKARIKAWNKTYIQKKRDALNAYRREWNRKNPRGDKAKQLVHYAVKLGILVKPEKCEYCERKASMQAHHYAGYEKPLDVHWLCVSCHLYTHRKRILVAGQRL